MLQKNKLDFSDFFSISSPEWKSKILKELKSSSEEILIKSSGALGIKGFYNIEDIKSLRYLNEFHNHLVLKSPRHWYTAEYIDVGKETDVESTSLNALKKGADAIFMDGLTSITDVQRATACLPHLPLSFSQVIARTSLDSSIRESFFQACPKNIKGISFSNTPFTSYKHSSEKFLSGYFHAFQYASNLPGFKSSGIDASEIHHLNSVKEIAYTIGLALDIFDYLTNDSIPANDVLNSFAFSFVIGKNYFTEITKLRAFRYIWQKVATACSPDYDGLVNPVHCMTDKNSFSEDPYTNILHNTTEAMAAVLGGCDSLTIIPFGIKSELPADFSSRISRNISLLLKEEAYLEIVVDPLGGSYTIESLTDQTIEKAWKLISEIENAGGLKKYMERNPTL